MDVMTSNRFCTWMLVVSLWVLPGLFQEIVTPQKNVEVVKGQMVVLQASYRQAANMRESTVIWNLESKPVISFATGDVKMGDQQFADRVRFLAMPSNNLSILINDTREEDTGYYTCQVVYPSFTPSEGITLTVKVPPSVPACRMEGKPVQKGNITLVCLSTVGKPAAQYSWTRSTPGNEIFHPPALNKQAGTLKLTNLTSSMSGKYVCQASNTAGSESCFIELRVSTSVNAGVIAGATIGSVLGLLVIILFLYFILRRKSDSEDDFANDIKEDAQAPKRVSWAKSGSGSDIVSKNGTLSSITTSPHQRDHRHNHQYPSQAMSDTASIITATGSTAGYRPHYSEAQHIQGFNSGVVNSGPRSLLAPPSSNGSTLQRVEQAEPQAPRPNPVPVPTSVTAANIARMGGVPIMVPAQNQAGSLV